MRGWFGWSVGAFLMFWGTIGWACSFPKYGWIERRTFPPSEQTIPRNPKLLVIYEGALEWSDTKGMGELRLLDPQKKPVDVEIQKVEDPRPLYVVTPKGLLVAKARYTLESKHKSGCGGSDCVSPEYEEAGVFYTNDVEDTQPPVFEGALEYKISCSYHKSSCGEGYLQSSSIRVGGLSEVAYFRVYDARSPTKPLIAFATGFSSQSAVTGSWDPGTYGRSEPFPPRDSEVIIRAVDLAGNEENNTRTLLLAGSCPPPPKEKPQQEPRQEPQQESSDGGTEKEVQDEKGGKEGGCGGGSGPGSGWIFLALGLGVRLRRRR